MGGDLMARAWDVPGYTEVKVLGSGGFGEVVLARHDASGTAVAIKYLRGELLADLEFAALFRAEAAVLASLDDPNVVRLYEYVESSAGAAIVMGRRSPGIPRRCCCASTKPRRCRWSRSLSRCGR
jgi:serine/threonine protein kinase